MERGHFCVNAANLVPELRRGFKTPSWEIFSPLHVISHDRISIRELSDANKRSPL